jgi:hypothetical protein
MEDLKINIDKLNDGIKNDLPEVKRTETGEIDLEAITITTDEKGNRIIPDEIFNAYYKELPEKVINKSKTWRTTPTGGKIKIFGGDPEDDKRIHQMGANTVNAAKAQRRTFAEIIEDTLTKKANSETIEDLELTEDTDHLTAIIAAAVKRAERGDVKAMEFIRDTIGQKPTEKLAAEVTALTPEDKELLERVSKRLEAE